MAQIQAQFADCASGPIICAPCIGQHLENTCEELKIRNFSKSLHFWFLNPKTRKYWETAELIWRRTARNLTKSQSLHTEGELGIARHFSKSQSLYTKGKLELYTTSRTSLRSVYRSSKSQGLYKERDQHFFRSQGLGIFRLTPYFVLQEPRGGAWNIEEEGDLGISPSPRVIAAKARECVFDSRRQRNFFMCFHLP